MPCRGGYSAAAVLENHGDAEAAAGDGAAKMLPLLVMVLVMVLLQPLLVMVLVQPLLLAAAWCCC